VDPAIYPYWPLASLAVCTALLVVALAAGLETPRVRALALLSLALAADAAFALAGLAVAESARQPWSAALVPVLALWFVGATYPAGRARTLFPWLGAVLGGSTVAVFGGVAPDLAPAASAGSALFYGAVAAHFGACAASFWALAAAHRGDRDPVERNRVLYSALGIIGLCAASLCVWLPQESWHVVRQALNAASAVVLGTAALRRSLPDFGAVVRRGVGHLIVGVPTSFLYVGALIMLMRVLDVTLSSLGGLALAVLLSFGAVAVASYLRAVSAQLVDAPFEAHRRVREAHLTDLASDSGRLVSIDELALALTASCQVSLGASFVALLSAEAPGAPLRLVNTGGAERQLPPNLSIGANNEVLARLVPASGCITPSALTAAIESGSIALDDAGEFDALRDCVLAPLVSQGVTIGLLVVGPRLDGRAFRLADLDLLAAVAARGALSLQNAQLIEQLRAAAQTDFITGLPNHRDLQEVFTRLLDDAVALGSPLSCGVLDIDDFRHFNETYGRQSGDEALSQVARIIVDAAGREAVVGRYGGDEFLVLLPGTSRDAAVGVLQAIRLAVSALTLTPAYAPPGAATSVSPGLSWGLAAYPEDGATRRALTSVADSRLMQRKFERRQPASVGARPAAGQLLESDPEKLRVARGLLELIAAKDPETAARSQQIASFALLVADDLRLSERERYELWLGSLLHDVGKVGTPEGILAKSTDLTPEEWVEVRKHAALGEGLVRGLLDREAVTEIVGCHHERFDGLGYPRGLTGEEIPRMARIVAVADAFSAMVHDRPHRTQFDPAVIEVFLRAVGRADYRLTA
jgi:diguanylate cyclase (GGDEF)-like protein